MSVKYCLTVRIIIDLTSGESDQLRNLGSMGLIVEIFLQAGAIDLFVCSERLHGKCWSGCNSQLSECVSGAEYDVQRCGQSCAGVVKRGHEAPVG